MVGCQGQIAHALTSQSLSIEYNKRLKFQHVPLVCLDILVAKTVPLSNSRASQGSPRQKEVVFGKKMVPYAFNLLVLTLLVASNRAYAGGQPAGLMVGVPQGPVSSSSGMFCGARIPDHYIHCQQTHSCCSVNHPKAPCPSVCLSSRSTGFQLVLDAGGPRDTRCLVQSTLRTGATSIN